MLKGLMDDIKEVIKEEKKKIIVIGSIVLVLSGGLLLNTAINKGENIKVIASEKNNVNENNLEGNEENISESVIEPVVVSLDYIHGLVNSVVIADQKWGSKEITQEELDTLKNSTLYESDEKIRKYVDGWLSGDFSNSKDFHNYIWNKLGGTIGIATDNDMNAIQATLERLKK